MKYLLLFVIGVSLTVPARPIDWFVLIGQSNMMGAAELPASQTSMKRIYNFTNAWTLQRSPLEPIDSNVNQVDMISRDANPGYGASLQFAKSYLKLAGKNARVGLIPCAASGTSIAWWQRSENRNTLYGSCLARARYVQEHYNGTIRGLIVWQGESDTLTLERAQAWPRLFVQFMRDFRADITRRGIPVVFVQIADGMHVTPHWEYMRDVQQPSVLVGHPNYAMVPSIDQPTRDGRHMTIAGYDVMGARIARAMYQLLERNK